MSNRKVLGVFVFGIRAVRIIADKKMWGGEFDCAADDGMAEIVVGFAAEKWHDALGVLLHETMEMSLADLGCRWRGSPDYAGDNGRQMFVMDHTTFSEACGRAAILLAQCVPVVADAYRAMRQTARRRRCR